MKKINLILGVFSLSALTFVSCKKDEKPAATGETMTFTGRIGGGGAKTEINGFEMTWSENDQVRINSKVFESELTTDRKTATFTGEYLMPPYEAYYPAGLYDETGNKYVLPKTQHYAGGDGKVLSDVSPMYAGSNTTDLQFHNICAMIRLDVTGKGTVKTIKVSSETPLSGEFEIKGDAETGFYARLKPSSSKADHDTLTLDCGEGVELDGTTAKKFYVAVPKGEYTDLKFTMVDDDNRTLNWSSDAVSHDLEAGKLYTKTLADVEFVKPETLSGVFSVSATAKVKFSRGNLQCVRKGYTWAANGYEWRFAANQWDVVETTAGVSADYASQAVVTLFGWGTSGQNHGAACYQPWSISTTYSDYYAYNDQNKNLYDNGGSADWGYSYCEQEGIEPKTTWCVLTKDEWTYLFNSRTVNGGTGEGKSYQRATINSDAAGVYGMILYPDGYASGAKTSYTSSEWATAESAGCVFLPAAGSRYGTSVYDVGSNGDYWSSSYYGSSDAYRLYFYSGYVFPAGNSSRNIGFSVRLVREIK